MPDLSSLKDLNPLWISGLVAFLLVREFFSYLKTQKIKQVVNHDAALVATLGKINVSITAQTSLIEAQTELTREMSSSLKRVIHEVDELRDDLELVSDDVKEIKKTQKQGE